MFNAIAPVFQLHNSVGILPAKRIGMRMRSLSQLLHDGLCRFCALLVMAGGFAISCAGVKILTLNQRSVCDGGENFVG